MRALVTGWCWLYRSSISNYLLDKGHEVIIVDNLSQEQFIMYPKRQNFINLT